MVESDTEATPLAIDIHLHFLQNGWEWGSGKDAKTPTPEEIDEGLGFLKKRLEREADGTTIFGGRLAVQKTGDHHDIYVYFGDYNDS